MINLVTLQVSLKSLDLDEHGKDKFLRLVGERYDPATEVLTLVADRCPLSQQNHEYLHYLLTVLYNESMVREDNEGCYRWKDEDCIRFLFLAIQSFSSDSS